MRKIALVARREYREQVKTKSFIISILFLPILLIISTFLPTLFEKLQGEARRFSLVDQPGDFLADMKTAYDAKNLEKESKFNGKFIWVEPSEYGKTPEEQRAAMKKAVEDESLFAYTVIGAGVVEDGSGCTYSSKNLTETDLHEWLTRSVSAIAQQRRLAKSGVDPALVADATKPVKFEDFSLGKEGGEEKKVTGTERLGAYFALVFVYLMWISIFTISQMLLTSTLEEKANRTVEVVLSSCSPFEFMAGKVLGMTAMGLTLVSSWITCFLIFFKLIAPSFGGFFTEIDIGSILANPTNLAFFALCFILGLLLYSALFIGIGSVCNTIKEAQNLMGPATIILIIPLMTMMHTVKNPDSSLSVALTYIPFFTPFVLMNRVAAVPPPPTWQVLLALAVLVVSIWLMIKFSAKIFRIGILLYGKPPKLREIIRWARVS